MGGDDTRLAECLLLTEQLARSGAEALYRNGRNGNWGDVRSTAMAISVLRALGEKARSHWIAVPAKWLNRKAVRISRPDGIEGRCWESEVWDSALAISALCRAGVGSYEHLKEDTNWLYQIWEFNRANWHDEPWETAFAVNALLATKLPNWKPVLRAAAEWYINVHAEGRFINSVYTAFLTDMGRTYMLWPYWDREDAPFLERLSAAAQSGLRHLLARDFSQGQLWSNEAWANGYVLFAICKSDGFVVGDNMHMIEACLRWFSDAKSYPTGWADIEDTCSALEALAALYEKVRASLPSHTFPRLATIVQEGVRKPRISVPVVQMEDGDLILVMTPRVRRWLYVALVIAGGITTVAKLRDEIIRWFGALLGGA